MSWKALNAGLILLIPLLWGGPSRILASETLTDPTGYLWDIETPGYGSIINGTQDAYDNWPSLCVRNVSGDDSICDDSEIYYVTANASTELDGRQIVMASKIIGSLTVRRKIYVPSSGTGFLRYMDILTNNLLSRQTVNVRIGTVNEAGGKLGSTDQTEITSSQNGDNILDASDDWWCSDDATDGSESKPSLTHVVDGEGGTYSVTSAVTNAFSNGNGSIFWEYQDVEVPGRSSVIFLHFEAQSAERATAQSIAEAIYAQPDEIIYGLTSSEVEQISNWSFNVVPSAESGGPYSGYEGVAVELDGSGSSDPNGNIATYEWDCTNNGSYDISSEFPTGSTCTYADEGAYNLRLRVTDSTGFSATSTTSVSIANLAPEITSFDVPSDGDEGEELQFSAAATDSGTNDTLSYDWDFGDGGSGSGSDPLYTYADDGEYQVSLLVTDNDGGTSELETATVVISNVAPTIDALNVPGTGSEGSELTFTAVVDDPGSEDTLTYSWSFGDGVTTSGVDMDSVDYTYASDGTYTVTLEVTDDSEASDSAVAVIEIENAAPTILEIGGDFSGNEGDVFSFDATASDPGSDDLTYSWSFGDGSSATGQSVSHRYADDGEYELLLTVTDSQGASTEGSKTVSVANVAPSLATFSGPNQADEGESLTYEATASDPGTDSISFSWDFGDDSSAEGSEVAHTYADNGTYQLVLTLSDEDGGTTESTLEVVIDNVRPSIDKLEGTFTGEEGDELAFDATVSDPGDDTLTYSWVFGDGDTLEGVDLSSVSHIWTHIGTYTLTLVVSDDDGGEASSSRTINIGNGAPGISDITGDLSGKEGETLSITTLASDPSGETLTYTWDFGDGSENETGEGLSTVEHVYADQGDYVLRVTVTDSGGLTASADTIVVIKNANPTIDGTDVPSEGDEGELLQFSATASDLGVNDVLAFSWAFGDQSDPVEGASVSHTYTQNGSYSAVLTVSDQDGGKVSESFELTIHNVAPSISGIDGPLELKQGEEGSWTATVTDPGDDSLSYNWSFGDGQTSTSAGATHAYSAMGTYTLSLSITDQDGGEDSSSIEVSVENLPPTISTVNYPTSGDEGESLTFEIVASDPGGDSISINWDFGDGKAASGESVSHVYADNGVYSVTVSVSDENDATVKSSGEITIYNVQPEFTLLDVPSSGDEGELLTLQADWTDAGSADVLTGTVDWGDGASEALPKNSPLTHTYVDDGEYQLVVQVRDDDAGSNTQASGVVISNLPPVIAEFTGTLYGQAGEEFGFEAQATDPGTTDVLTYTYDFGDGSDSSAGVDLGSVSHIFESSGQYTVSLLVDDGDGDSAMKALTVNVGTGAPLIDGFAAQTSGNEGDEFSFSGEGIDPSGEAVTYTWDFGDGTEPLTGDDLTSVTHTYADDGEYTVRLTVTDPGGLTATANSLITVENVAPSILSTAPATAVEGTAYIYQLQVEDPAGEADPLEYLLDGAPEGMTVSGEGAVEWTPTLAQAETGTASFSIQVSDGDGGEASEAVTLSVSFVDADGDSMPDSWEEANALDPTTDDAAEDPDEDGLTNLEEYQVGTDPHSANSPAAPEIISPNQTDASQIPVSLVVSNAVDPDGDVLTYHFQLFTDSSLTEPALDEAEDLPEGEEQTEWQPTVEWTEDAAYWWRARATDASSYGPWSDIATFHFNAQNSAPGAPVPSFPADGADAPQRPRLEVANAVDPDGGVLTYEFVVYDSFSGVVTLVAGVEEEEDGFTEWTVDLDLVIGESYTWQARATDSSNLSGEWSELSSFTVNVENDAPSEPELSWPESEGEVATTLPILEVYNSSDPDGDVLSYFFEVDADDSFTSEALQSSDAVPEGAEGTTLWQVTSELSENQIYFWRVQADDGLATSSWSSDWFRVNTVDEAPPVPTLHNPSDGSTITDSSFELSLVRVEDPDGDQVSYTFVVRTDDGTELLRSEDNTEGDDTLVSLSADAEALAEEGDSFLWTAFATDEDGLSSEEAEPNSFTIDLAGGDDDTASGDDDTAGGDDDTSAGDDDTSVGDDDTEPGDDDSSPTPGGEGDDDSCACNVKARGGSNFGAFLLFAFASLAMAIRKRRS